MASKFISHFCKYDIILVTYKKRKLLTDQMRTFLNRTFKDLLEQKKCEVTETYFKEDYVHLTLEIPPQFAPFEIINYIKELSSVMIHRSYNKEQSTIIGESLWEKGCAISTSGFAINEIDQYVKDQNIN